jgi:hypothetical protein
MISSSVSPLTGFGTASQSCETASQIACCCTLSRILTLADLLELPTLLVEVDQRQLLIPICYGACPHSCKWSTAVAVPHTAAARAELQLLFPGALLSASTCPRNPKTLLLSDSRSPSTVQ